MKRIIETTSDGYNTIYIPEIDEHYHSVKGAYTESKHIFIDMGLNNSNSITPKILEVGFGTGLNAILTLIEANKKRKKVIYDTLELFPLDTSTILSLDYITHFDSEISKLFIKMHNAKWGERFELTEYFNIRKIECNFTDINKWWDGINYDIVYFDAFAPEKEPEMWNTSLFESIYNIMSAKGILVTYCAKGIIRRTLQSCGFKVERLQGPPGGKREILRATKI